VGVSAGATVGFKVTAFPTADVSGVAHYIGVTAVDAYGNQAVGYRGSVFFSSSDAYAMLPANYTFTAADTGAHVFVANLLTVGSQSLIVADTMNTAILGYEAGINVASQAVALVMQGAPATITAGQSFTITVSAVNGLGVIDSQFPDTIHFSSNDPHAVLPADYTFQPGDNGSKTFAITLLTAGNHGLTITDVTRPAITATGAGTLVTAAAASNLRVSGYASPTMPGVAHGFWVTALDAFGNQATTYRGLVHFTSTDPHALLPADYTFTAADGGIHYFGATFATAGSQSLTATDSSTSSIQGAQTIGMGLAASLSGPALGVLGQPLSFTLNTLEPGATSGATFAYYIDWDGIGSWEQVATGPSSLTLSHVYTTTGPRTVRVAVVDGAGNVSSIITQPLAIQTVALEPDPANASQTALAIGGSVYNDTITLTPADPTGRTITVNINGVVQAGGPFAPTGHILVYGQSGYDTIQEVAQTINGQSATVAIPALIFAGSGNDTLSVAGSSANNVLVGGTGNNMLIGGSGRDILIGGGGSDVLRAGSGDDILIGGTTAYNGNLQALLAIMAEWGRTDRSYSQRVQDLYGDASGGLNGGFLLNPSTVTADNTTSQFFGGTGAGLDWFWISEGPSSQDQVNQLTGGDVVTVR
jgi:Ca2+-binding RTX toxin-like protein